MAGLRDRVKDGLKKLGVAPRKVPLPEEVILRLGKKQLYPKGSALTPDFLMHESYGLLDRSTPIASIGSCFAREIKDYLESHDFNYVQTAEGPNARHGSAAWDRVYNTFCLRQEFERALGCFEPSEAFWELDDGRVLDPYRKDVQWESLEEARAGLAEHKRTARLALTQARVLVVTVGLTEIWHSKDDDSVFFQVPPADIYEPSRHEFRVSTFTENLENLERVRELLHAENPDCKLVITVSPVPLRATFRDENVVSCNVQSKSTLLTATREFCSRHDNVWYFPSYELVSTVIPDPFEEDNRHVKRTTVNEIMRVFENNFMV